MNWLTIRTWAMANLRTVVFGAGIILLLGYLLFGGSSPNPDIPGGGFGTLIASALLFWGVYKTTGMGSKALGVIATILLVVWAWPRIFPFLDAWGFVPNLIFILAILAFIWMWKSGKGLFAWRMFLFIFLVVCWIGAKGVIFKDSFNAFLSSTGIEFKIPEMPETVKNITTGFSGYMKNFSAQKISQSKERLVKNGSTFYSYDGINFTKKDFSSEEEFIKVFILGEPVQKNGFSYNNVRIGDPATGEDAWVYSGILLISPTASTPPPASKTGGNAPEWETVGNCPIHFSGRTFSTTVGPDGERANTGEVYTECFLENGYDYKITFSGEYTKKLITQEHKVSWRGFNPQSQGIAKPFPDYDFGALMLRIGNQVGIHPEKGKDFVVFAPMDSEKVFAEINVNRDPEEYHDSKGSKLKNSTLSIKIERRPL